MLCDPPVTMLAGDLPDHRKRVHPDWPPPFPGALGLRQPYDPNGHEIMEAGWEHECG